MRTGNVEKLGGEGFAFVGDNFGAKSGARRPESGNGKFPQSEPIQNNSGRDRLSSRKIRCPYCQEEFVIREILFRAEKPETEKTIREKTSEQYTAEELEEANRFKADGTRLRKFWAEDMYWGDSVNVIREVDGGYAEIRDSESTKGTKIDDVSYYILKDDQIDWKSLEVVDGYPISVKDTRGIETQKMVCPECHCVLPDAYGCYNIFFVACVGIPGSGKTVLLSQIFYAMNQGMLISCGVETISNTIDEFIEEKKVICGEILPGSTEKESVKPPIPTFIRESGKGESGNAATVVFYDIAGENCVNADGMRKYGKFIKNADGILMMVSPEQIPKKGENLWGRDPKNNIVSVINCINEAYANNNTRLGRKKASNFAIVISKSDKFYIQRDKNGECGINEAYRYMARDIEYGARKGYKKDQHDAVVRNVTAMLSETALPDLVNNLYKKVTFFAVSSLGDEAIKVQKVQEIEGKREEVTLSKAPEQINPKRIEEPFMWLFWKFGIIDKVDDRSWLDKVIEWVNKKFGGRGGN